MLVWIGWLLQWTQLQGAILSIAEDMIRCRGWRRQTVQNRENGRFDVHWTETIDLFNPRTIINAFPSGHDARITHVMDLGSAA